MRELLAAGRRRARGLYVATGLDDSPIVAEILELSRAHRVPVHFADPSEIARRATTEAPQGIVAYAEPLPSARIDSLARAGRGDAPPFLVVLDAVTDPYNLGSVLRSALCAGATGAVLASHHAASVTPAAAKAAAGAIEHLPIAMVPGAPSGLAQLGEAGVWRVGLDAAGGEVLSSLDLLTGPVALVLGAEGHGIGRLSRQRCDVVARIETHGPLGSVSVSAAAAVACFTVATSRAMLSDT